MTDNDFYAIRDLVADIDHAYACRPWDVLVQQIHGAARLVRYMVDAEEERRETAAAYDAGDCALLADYKPAGHSHGIPF